jgi:hypothetical protein
MNLSAMNIALSYWRRERYCWMRDVYVDSMEDCGDILAFVVVGSACG